MGATRLTQFGGIMPRTAERLLAENAAQIATNCRLSSGELIPFNTPSLRYASAKAGPLLAIHRIAENGSLAWLTWAYDVDVVKSPTYGTARWCFTGDGEPRITSMADAISGSGNDYPHTAYTLGTPKPVTVPTVTPSATGVGATVDRSYAYTFYAAWGDIEFEGAVSPISALQAGKVDDTWAITGMDATPPNSGTVTGAHASGVTTFTDTVPHWLRVGEEVVVSGTTMAVTEVASTLIFKVAGDYSAATAWARKASFPGTLYKRLYRTTGTTGQMQAVAEGITGTTYNDVLTDAQILGDELISASWDMPPTGLTGLIVLPSNALCGFVDNKICFSEPSQPHAWPTHYQIAVDYPAVGVASFGTGVGVATEATPVVINGTEPGQMSADAWPEVLPCLSKRSVVSLGDRVLYASQSGMVALSAAGAVPWSLPYFTDLEFAAYAPSSMVSALSERRLYVLYETDSTTRVLIFNLNGDNGYLTEAHFDASEICVDPSTGALFFAFGSDIYEFDPADGFGMTQEWMSKEIVLPLLMNPGAAKVVFDAAVSEADAAAIVVEIAAVTASNAALLAAGDANGAWNESGWNVLRYAGSEIETPPEVPPANTVDFSIYADGVLKGTKTVENSRPFTLPSGYKTDAVAVRVSGRCRIKSIEIAANQRGLKQA